MKVSIKRLMTVGLCLAALSVGFVYGVGFGRYEIFPFEQVRALRNRLDPEADQYGRWHKARESSAASAIDDDTLDQLSSLGYLGGYKRADGAGGVTVLDQARVQPGLTLFSSGQTPVVYLMSPTGEMVHQWEVKFEELWPDGLPFDTEADKAAEHREFIRRAYVFPNGDLLGVFEYIGIFKLDKDSNVLWKSASQNHHDFAIAADGTIATLVRHHIPVKEVSLRYPGFKPADNGIYDDQIVLLDASGTELKRVSLFDAFYQSDFGSLLGPRDGISDVFHTNSVNFVEEWRSGSPLDGEVLISMRDMDAIARIDLHEERVSWFLAGPWRGQHQAQPLANGNILLLDNLGGNQETPLLADQSEVLEIDPLSHEIVWRYAGSDRFPFFTEWLGYVERLANGNTLVTESTEGRLIEVTRKGRIVWEYLSPHRTGGESKLIATVMGARRIQLEDLDFIDPSELKLVESLGGAE